VFCRLPRDQFWGRRLKKSSTFLIKKCTFTASVPLLPHVQNPGYSPAQMSAKIYSLFCINVAVKIQKKEKGGIFGFLNNTAPVYYRSVRVEWIIWITVHRNAWRRTRTHSVRDWVMKNALTGLDVGSGVNKWPPLMWFGLRRRHYLIGYIARKSWTAKPVFSFDVVRCPCSHYDITPPKSVLWWMNEWMKWRQRQCKMNARRGM